MDSLFLLMIYAPSLIVKVKTCKSFLFTEGSLKVENEEHLFDFVVTLYFSSLCCNALRSARYSYTSTINTTSTSVFL